MKWPKKICFSKTSKHIYIEVKRGVATLSNEIGMASYGEVICNLGLTRHKSVPMLLTRLAANRFRFAVAKELRYKRVYPIGSLIEYHRRRYRVLAWDRCWMILLPEGKCGSIIWAVPCERTYCIDQRLSSRWQETTQRELAWITAGYPEWSTRRWR